MNGNWVLKVYLEEKKITKIKRICWRKTSKKQGNCLINYYINKPRKEMRRLKRIGVKYTCYRVEFERATNYRKVFFARTKGPYRCRYCHKPLNKKESIFVDHIIPVAKSQKSRFARMLLSLNRCGNVNDIRNLAPACRECNLKKSDKMGLWVVRGWLGKYKIYWIIRMLLKIGLAVFLIIAIIWIFTTFIL